MSKRAASLALAAFIVAALIPLLASCGWMDEPEPSASPAQPTAPVTPSPTRPPRFEAHEPDNPLRVIFDKNEFNEAGFEHINHTLWRLGFNLMFEPHDAEQGFHEYVANNIDEPNMVFAGTALDMGVFRFHGIHLEASQLGDHSMAAEHYAPTYFSHPLLEQVNYNNPGMLLYLPLGAQVSYPDIPAVLIREDATFSWGQEVRAGSQIIEVLEWLKRQAPDSIPGVAFGGQYIETRIIRDGTIINAGVYSMLDMFLPYETFLPEHGYRMVNRQPHILFDLTLSTAVPAHHVPESRDAIETFARLRYEGLLYVKTNDRFTLAWGERGFDEFPVILTGAYNFLSMSESPHRAELRNMDASEYWMYTLYTHLAMPKEEPRFYNPANAIAGWDTDISEFLRFLEWMTVPDNYILMMYGERQWDYELTADGRLIPSDESDVDWLPVRSHMKYFARSSLEPIPVNAPANYESELRRIAEWPVWDTSEEGMEQLQAHQQNGNTVPGTIQSQFANLNNMVLASRRLLPPEEYMVMIDLLWDEYDIHGFLLWDIAYAHTGVYQLRRIHA